MHRIVHRDLKSLNVLLDEAWSAKISDFGLAKVNSTVAASTGGDGYHSKVGTDCINLPPISDFSSLTKFHICLVIFGSFWCKPWRKRATRTFRDFQPKNSIGMTDFKKWRLLGGGLHFGLGGVRFTFINCTNPRISSVGLSWWM